MTWQRTIHETAAALESLEARDKGGRALEVNGALARWRHWTLKVQQEKKRAFLIGNGASASMASHVAADLSKNAMLSAEVFSDLSLITAIANDLSYEEVFAEPLRRRMSPGDLLVAISSSGNSPNILRAAETAKELEGTVVTLSAMGPTNALRRLGDLNFYVDARTYGLAETVHAAILHYWIDRVIEGVEESRNVARI